MRFNKVCEESDWDIAELKRVMAEELRLPPDYHQRKERKHWEWALGWLALQEYGYLRADRRALGLACGHEAIMYALTNHLQLVVGTDLYGQTVFTQEADPSILRDVGRFCPFPFQPNRLLVRSMDALAIDFADGQFDIVFSFSSVEHFGPGEKVAQAMREAHRVLRRDGIYVLSLDYVFSRPPGPAVPRNQRQGLAGEILTREEVLELILKPAPFRLRQAIRFDVDPARVTNVFDIGTRKTSTGNDHPHIYLSCEGYLFTSLLLVLFK